MPLPPTRKTIAKKVSSLYILASENTIKVQRVKLKTDLCHSLYHKALKGKLRQSSFLAKIIENPERILEIKGSRKINLILYLVFIKETGATDLRPLKHITCSLQQKLLRDLLSLKNKAWGRLFRKYPGSFVKLQKHLQTGDAGSGGDFFHPDGKLGCSTQILRNGRAFASLLRHSWHGEHPRDDLPRAAVLHRDFCEVRDHNYIQKFGQDYIEMVENVLSDSSTAKMVSSSLFFPEIRLYNDYLLTRDDPDFFDQFLLRQRLTTLSERGIRDYVRRKLEEKTYE